MVELKKNICYLSGYFFHEMTQTTKDKTFSTQSSLSISLLSLVSQREESATCWTKAMFKT